MARALSVRVLFIMQKALLTPAWKIIATISTIMDQAKSEQLSKQAFPGRSCSRSTATT